MTDRESNKQRTRRALADAAAQLFAEHGYANVTMSQVAGRAGVSRRTAFRYFASKDELLLEYPRRWMEVFEASIAEYQDQTIQERLRLAAHSVVAHIEADAEPTRQAFGLAFSHPALAASYAASNQEWVERVSREIEPDPEASNELRVRARIMASAYMGMINGISEIWAETDVAMGPLIDESFKMLVLDGKKAGVSG